MKSVIELQSFLMKHLDDGKMVIANKYLIKILDEHEKNMLDLAHRLELRLNKM